MPEEEGYTGNGSEYRGNGVTRYVLERIDALDEKIDAKLEIIQATAQVAAQAASELGTDLRDIRKDVTEHQDGHEDWVKSRKRIEKWVAGAALTFLTVGSGVIAAILSR